MSERLRDIQEGATISCRFRSYISTCCKQGVFATEALRLVFEGRRPEFMSNGTIGVGDTDFVS